MEMLQSDGKKKGNKNQRGGRRARVGVSSSQASQTKMLKQQMEKKAVPESKDAKKREKEARRFQHVNDVVPEKAQQDDVHVDLSELGELTSQPHAEDTLLF